MFNLFTAKQISESHDELILKAQNIANSLELGQHGRKNAGFGHSFWQYRAYAQGDDIKQVDWRQSAKRQDLHIKEKEWETVNKALLICHNTPSLAYENKRDKARLILLTIAFLLQKGGEHFSSLEDNTFNFNNNTAHIEELAHHLTSNHTIKAPVKDVKATPIVAGDFFCNLNELEEYLKALPEQGHLIQIIAPQESQFPFKGPTIFKDMEGQEEDLFFSKTEELKRAYLNKFNRHQLALRQLCNAKGYHYHLYQTDQPLSTFLHDFIERSYV